MSVEAGNPQDKSIFGSPEKERLSSSEIQEIITQSHRSIYRDGRRLTYEQISLDFFKEYENSPDGPKTIEKLIEIAPKITAEEIQQSYISGLSKNFSVVENIPKLSDYQPEEIAQAFTHRFNLIIESFSRISKIFPPSKTIIKQIIEYPNYLEPDFYEYFIKQIKEDGYYCKANICLYLIQSPKFAKEKLEQDSETFEIVKQLLITHNPTQTINYTDVRKGIEQQGKKFISIINKDPDNYYLTLKEVEQKEKQKNGITEKDETISRLLQDKKTLLSERRTLKAENSEAQATIRNLNAKYANILAAVHKLKEINKTLLSERRTLKAKSLEVETTIRKLEAEKKVLQKQRTRSKSADRTPNKETKNIFPKEIIPRAQDNQNTLQSTKNEVSVEHRFIPAHPIDYVSSKNLTAEQQIRDIKEKSLANHFSQDWVIEYYVRKYSKYTNEELIEKLIHDEEIIINWKDTLLNKNFKDDWILEYFLVYYPGDYKNCYFEAEKAFNYFREKFPNKNFTTTDILKKIVVYYYQDRTEAIEIGCLLYTELEKEFAKTEFVKSNSSVINRYIIRNFDNPAEDLRNAIKQFNLLLSNTLKDSDNFFLGLDKTEINTENYLRLLFEHHPTEPESSIGKIKDVYKYLKIHFENDSFFGDYKELAFKIVAISSTEKPDLGYEELKSKIKSAINATENKKIDRNDVIRIYLSYSEDRIPLHLNLCRSRVVK